MTLPHIQVNKEWELVFSRQADRPPGEGGALVWAAAAVDGAECAAHMRRVEAAERRRGGRTLFFLYKNLLAIS